MVDEMRPQTLRSVVFHDGSYINVETGPETSCWDELPEVDQTPENLAAHNAWIDEVHDLRVLLTELCGTSGWTEDGVDWTDVEWEDTAEAYRTECRCHLAAQTGLVDAPLEALLNERLA